MLGLDINGERLDLSPGTTAQLERISPFLSLDSLAGEYTLPFTFSYTPRNARLLGLPNHFYTRRVKKTIAVRLFDNNNFSYTGDLIIEAAKLNVNDITKSTINGKFVTGVSSFFQPVKKKKLKELVLGGVRTFAWTNNNPASTNLGFWQHIHKTLAGTMDYSFAPIANEKWAGSNEPGTPDWMNKLGTDGNLDFDNNYNTLAPQVSLKYLLQQVFTEHGWDFDYSEMNDDQWQTLFIPSFYSVTWQKIIQVIADPFFDYAPLNNININLQNHVPPDMLITELLLALRNRYNWGFDFDSSKRVCKMRPLKNLANGARKDWTKYMNPKWDSDFSEDVKIFAFRNEIDSSDALSSKPDLIKITMGDPVLDFEDLPAPVEANFNLVVYCWKQNQYFQNRYNEDDQVYEWAIYADNIYDYEPTGNNEDIATVASTMPMYKREYRNIGVPYYGLFPLCEQEGNWDGKEGDFVSWGLRLLFHRGLVWEANAGGTMGLIKYPYLTSSCFTITQDEADLVWSNVYRQEFEGVDKGILNYWWKDTLKYLEQSDVITGILNLPRQELLNFSWSDVILLRNIPHIVQKFTEVIPYNKTVETELRRIG
ncbi:MAG: hypothetical protein ABI675_19505 [Chitinophagaceae bacterium]